jgi:ribose/xylose/arabinose/galactoside ABC-type transport system permease subunit
MEIPAEISNLALWTSIVAFFAPVVLDLIIQSGWSARVQAIVAFLASALIGTLTAFFSGAFNGVGIVTGILLAFVVTISAYKGFWKPVAPNLKEATSVDAPDTPDSGAHVSGTR